MAETVRFTKEAKEALEHMLDEPTLQAMSKLKAIMVLSTGVPVVSALLLIEALIDSMVNANDDDPEFCEFVRTRLLNALVPKAVNHGKGD